METGMVSSELFDNRFALSFNQTKEFIKNISFSSELEIRLFESKNHGMSFGLSYSIDNAVLYLKSERGYLTYEVQMDKKIVDLNNFDNRLTNIEVTSKKNILFLFGIIQKYLRQSS